MNQQNLMLALFVALGVVLATGLVVVPVIEEADAKEKTCVYDPESEKCKKIKKYEEL